MVVIIKLLFLSSVFSQISIFSDDFPSEIGTLIITENDTTQDRKVDVGLPGENQIWTLDQDISGVMVRQHIVEKEATPFLLDFPESNIAIRYTGKLGFLLHTYYFDETHGEIYCYQYKSNDSLFIQGIGLDSSQVIFGEFSANYSGFTDIQPDLLLHSFPLQYGDSSISISHIPIEIETEFMNMPTKLLAEIKDSTFSVVDGWGTLILPSGSYECLRIKSYITLNEDLYANGILFRSRKTRTINYQWIAKEYGVIAKVISHSNEPDDNFTISHQLFRVYLFNPTIELSTEDTSAAPQDTVNLPIYISDLTGLNITSIQMNVNFNTDILTPLKASSNECLASIWGEPNFTTSDSGISLNLKGETPLKGRGKLCFIQFLINNNAQVNDSSDITFNNIRIEEIGPTISAVPGKFYIKSPSIVTTNPTKELEKFILYSNYPNPFNSSTSIAYEISKPGETKLEIYNSLGQLINSFINHHHDNGIYTYHWNGKNFKNIDVPSGIYFYQLSVTPLNDSPFKMVSTKKMILLR